MLYIVDKETQKPSCPRPLSRKKLRQLMRHNQGAFTANILERRTGRESATTKKIKRLGEAEAKREREMLLAGVPAGESGPGIEMFLNAQSSNRIFKRLVGMFAGMTERFQRSKAKGH